ncbi:CHS7 [Cyberlindnera jadinii]|uniref:Chitin synthase export chaperone n=1 Tax=Cyberlindnera jadinii (strain ATCC 18201 / CBS 1600 / BCRC 20928 / JCM 3617 / NBRC 0987 / NRRL Y-1542) TaxID=983966 RepID=A0A0H5C2N1_CYBJN|nr:CHS7 [Cyberlindnera jadinii]
MAFGDFNSLCHNTPLPLCQVVKATTSEQFTHLNEGIIPECYARPIDVANTVIFQIGNAFVNIGALVIMIIIIYNVRSKYTAIGRLEMLFFFYLILALIVATLVVDCGVSPPGTGSYPYFVALQLGLASASCWCLMICGFLGFRMWEDGTKKSMWFLRLSTLAFFILTFVISLITFNDWILNNTIDSEHTTGLFVVIYVFNAIFLAIYIVSQILLALLVIKNYWVVGVIGLAVASFIIGQVLMYACSKPICEGVNHYIDGLFFGSLCNLFSIMMLYKFWDMTTDDDLEFSISIDKDGAVLFAER